MRSNAREKRGTAEGRGTAVGGEEGEGGPEGSSEADKQNITARVTRKDPG